MLAGLWQLIGKGYSVFSLVNEWNTQLAARDLAENTVGLGC
jgi:hypothetical protein